MQSILGSGDIIIAFSGSPQLHAASQYDIWGSKTQFANKAVGWIPFNMLSSPVIRTVPSLDCLSGSRSVHLEFVTLESRLKKGKKAFSVKSKSPILELEGLCWQFSLVRSHYGVFSIPGSLPGWDGLWYEPQRLTRIKAK